MDFFQEKVGYGRGCPWSCPLAREVQYNAEEYPETINFVGSHAYLSSVYPPNDMKLMALYLDGLRKATNNIERVLELAAD